MPRRVAIVPHTHWDREWYQPFQTFRLRLVDLLDDLLDRLEADDAWPHFLLDGQVAVIDDYLEVRPEAEPRLRALCESGRLAIGPWYVLMDEFCVSGETIVRDLQRGLTRAEDFGGAMAVGYLPDMFGHVAQMPQLLRLAGFEHAVVWRGVPAAVDRTAFWWRAPDGSTVRAEYLPVGYGNGSSLPDDPAALLRRVRAHEAELGDLLLDGMLVMNGSDHELPQPWLPAVVGAANRDQHDYELAITSLPAYLATAPTDGIPCWEGELRSGARANLLMGVASNRVDVKQAAAGAERALERLAEPLSALFRSAERWPAALLDIAWGQVIRNAAHDSVCACSVDEVVDQVLERYAEARQIADGLTRRAVSELANTLAAAGPVVVNPSARTRSGTVELLLPSGPPVVGAQLVRGGEAASWELHGVAGELEALLGAVHTRNREIEAGIRSIAVAEDGRGFEVSVATGAATILDPAVRTTVAELYARAGARPTAPLQLRVDEHPPHRLAVRVDDVAGFGWQTWTPAPLRPAPVTRVGAHALANGLVTVEVGADGTFSLNGCSGLDRLVDDGDEGDTYNYSPPVDDEEVDHPDSVTVTVDEDGPVRGRLRIERMFRWPERVEGGRRVGARPVLVTTDLVVHAGERAVRVTTSFDNTCRDHRLRAWFPLPERVETSRAECAFAVVERGLQAEGGPHEHALPTWPSRRFVQAGGLTIAHEGLLEYELVDDGKAMALTLLRATGMLSRDGMAYRSRPAGPAIAAAGAQLAGPRTVRYAVTVDPCDPYTLVDDVFLPLLVATAPGAGDRGAAGSLLRVEGAEVSALQRRAGAIEVRVFNPSAAETLVRLAGRVGDVVDLRGQIIAPFDGEVALRPWGIATLRLKEDR